MASADHKEHRVGGMMHPKVAAKLLDRLAELAKGNEERTMEYLTTMTTNAERQQKLKEQRLAAGIRPLKVWVDHHDDEALRARFPGSRGGIDWKKVIRAALLWTVTEDTSAPDATPPEYNLELERLRRKINQLEKDHARGIANYRQTIADMDSKLAILEHELKSRMGG